LVSELIIILVKSGKVERLKFLKLYSEIVHIIGLITLDFTVFVSTRFFDRVPSNINNIKRYLQ